MQYLLNKFKKIIPATIFKAVQPYYHFVLSWISALFYGFPSEKLIVIGVTGTTGKTTSVYFIAKTLEEAGYKVGYTSTAMFSDGDKEWLNDKKMTMVGRFFTQKMLARMVGNNCRYAIIESTSEGMKQFRHRFLNYDILVFTSLYPEHIESHGGFENYKKAKGMLFSHLKKCGIKYVDEDTKVHNKISALKKIELTRVKKTIIANLDDEHAGYFLDFWAERKIGYTGRDDIDKEQEELPESMEVLYFKNTTAPDSARVSFSLGSQDMGIEKTEFNLVVMGEFNISNALGAISVCLSQDLAPQDIKRGIEKIKKIPGRLEVINAGQKFTIVVDHAFEPNAVRKLYDTVENIPHNRIIHLLGSAGGGRDAARRPKLGELAGRKADIVIVANEDPYDEDPRLIIDQVASGAKNAGKYTDENLFKILDRREAIRKALELAQEDDLVLVTGKGCEQGICGKDGKITPWDDRKVVKEEVKKIRNS
jgi:UDP-N-acetylmuramoyl-L-alanyl-D-glutamate--2,6-diaminopimelate ligase